MNGNLIASNTNNFEATEAGDYLVSVETSEGCINSGMVQVTVNSLPEISVDDIILCPGEMQSIILDNGFTEYIWTGITASGPEVDIQYQSVDNITTEQASVMVVDGNGCSAATDFSITYNPELNVQLLAESYNICQGESIELEVSGGVFYEWSDASGSLSATNIANPVATPTTTTTYNLSVTDNCPSNFAEFDVTVTVNDLPDIDAGQDTTTLAGLDFELMASGGTQYLWNNTDLIVGSSNLATVVINIDQDTVFSVTGIDENGCQNTDSVRVRIIEDASQVVTPITLITPNGDMINDFLEFEGLTAFPENKLTVFNRWGNVIFTKPGYQSDNIRWDGTRDGEELPADTYYYILEFADFKIKTSITLLRD